MAFRRRRPQRGGVKKWRRMRKYRKIARKPSQGFLKITRKLPLIVASNNTGVVGTLNATDPTGSCLFMGTPVPKTGYNQVYDVPFSLAFNFNQMVNAAELIPIADQYKMVSNLIRIECPATTSQMPGGNSTPTPYVEYIQDYDENAVPNVNTFREKMGIKTKYFSSTKPVIKMGVRPKPTSLFYDTGLANGYGRPRSAPWLDTTSTTVPHYGIKGVLRNVWLPAVVNSSPFTFDISAKVLLKDIQ